MIIINPTIQDRGQESADQYWQKVLRVKSLRIMYGLQNPKNNKPLVQTYSNTITAFKPNINHGWYTRDTDNLMVNHDGKEMLVIQDNTLYIEMQEPYPDLIPVYTVHDIKSKAKREKFLKAVGYTLISDPDNFNEYLPKVDFSRFNIPVIPEAITV